MLRRVLSPSGKVHASVASFNNHWGVPLTLARMPLDTYFGVFEVGMNHPDEIRPLVKMIEPHVAVITTIAPAHLGNFKSIKEIATAKAEIFEGVVPGGHACSTATTTSSISSTARRRPAASSISTPSASMPRPISAGGVQRRRKSSTLWITIDGETHEVAIGAPGRHIAENALAALGVVKIVGADMQLGDRSACDAAAEKGRGRRHKLAIDRMAASPSSTRATTPTRPRCGRRSRCWRARYRPDRAGGSPCSATCWRWAIIRRRCMPISPGRCWRPASNMSGLPARRWCAERITSRERAVVHREQTDELVDHVLNSVAPATC
jgi:UDP-N-acetylmuramoyl-tripeptide--D-alanyl-D-alanine ligase